MSRAQLVLGAQGEEAAARWYERAGYEVLARNWRCADGELDLVVSTAGLVVFCEVKTRSTERFGLPSEAVTWRKQARLRRLAGRWLASWHGQRPARIRFDVAAVVGTQVEVIEDAF
jgi:putative endonuclease